MKLFMPWLCLVAAANTSFAYVNLGVEAYRQGEYFKALQAFVKENKLEPVEAYYLGQMNLYGYGQLKNNDKALRYFSQAAEGGFLPAQEIMALYNLSEKNDPAQAFYWYKKSADANVPQANMYCAAAYLFGFGVSKNVDKARQYYIAAARQGNSIAQYTLAENFIDSRQGANKKLGLIWLDKAVAQKNPMAELLLAKLLIEGKIVAKDMDRANQLIDLAVDSGYAPAMVQKGDLARAQNDAEGAKTWYTKAADIGYLPGDLALGNLYLDEKSPLFNAQQGYLSILKAAQANLPAAQLALVAMYKSGKGVDVNEALAKEWQSKVSKSSATSPAIQAAYWLSNGKSKDFAASGYSLQGIFTDWKNADATKQNSYNPSPQMEVVTRDTLYKPNFVLTVPNDIAIGEYYDALASSFGSPTENKVKFLAYPQDETLNQIKDASEDNADSMIDKIEFEASLGNSVAQYDLGQLYQHGIGVKPDVQAAIHQYELAADQEELAAMYALGLLYLEGAQDLKADYSKGLDWLRKAAFKGSAYAQFALAQVYDFGLKNEAGDMAVVPDQEQADSFYFLASANNSGEAQYRLAEILVRQKQEEVSVVAKQMRQALIKSLYQGAVSNGVTQAELPLAFFNAMDPDKEKQKDAFKVARQAAEEGDKNAALLLGLLYDRGIGVESSETNALHWYRQAGSNAVSQFILGTYYSLGKGSDEDQKQGLSLLEKSANADFPYASLNEAVLNQQQNKAFLPQLAKALTLGNSKAGLLLADYYLSLASNDTQMKQARDIYQVFATKGDKEAQLKLAYMYEQGLGGLIDYRSAFTWYSASAEQGQPISQYLLGRLYQMGYLDVNPDYTLAKQWYSRAQSSYDPAAVALGFIYETVEDGYQQAKTSYLIAANHHDPVGQFNLGLVYEEGKGQSVDLEKAKALYEDAANKGHSQAMVRLAGLYFNGIDGSVDPQQALKWYKKAAALNDREALYQLGLLSETGVAIKLDLVSARDYYEQSARLGDQQGMLAAARMYQYGIGVAKDEKRAASYYETLAGLGNAFAQYQLSTLYDGKVLPESKLGEGRKWLEEALRNGSPQASKVLQRLATQKSGHLSYVEPVVMNQISAQNQKPVELMYMDALNQWNCGNEIRSKMIFDRIRAQFPDYTPAKRAYEQLSLG